MMTTLQLGARMLRYYKDVTALHDLPAPEAVALVGAINLGLGQFLSKLPTHRLETPFSQVLQAPVDMPISIVTGAKGFAYVNSSAYPTAGYSSEADAVGHTCTVAGDGQLNLLNRNSELLAGYLGATGTPTLTVYGDAVNLSENDQRLVSDLFLVDAAGQMTPLYPKEQSPWFYTDAMTHAIQRGKPEFWWVTSHLGNERTSSPLWHLRVWPLPSTAYSVRGKLKSFPPFLTFEDLYTARNLPLTIEEESVLECLIAPGLKTSAFLAPHIVKSDLDAAADRALARLETLNTPTRSGAKIQVGTPRGF